METVALFEYVCPECDIGTVHTKRVLNYKTKIKGFPFIVDEALIGVCDHCGAKQFAPEETKRWEELFHRSLEARQAVLSSGEITELRKTLGLSMEDFARLIGCTRQSVSNWEKTDRASPPLRMADLLMKLVRQSLHSRKADVLTFLLEEAKKWGVVIEVQTTTAPLEEPMSLVFRTKRTRRSALRPSLADRTLAAETPAEEEELTVVETAEGKPVGRLEYDYELAALILYVTNDLPPWNAFDVEIQTRDRRRLTGQKRPLQKGRLVLLEKSKVREVDVDRIVLKPHREEIRR